MAVAFGLMLVVGLHGDEVVAKKRKKSTVTATVDGKRRTFKKKNVTVDVGGGGVTIVATIAKPHLNQFVTGVGVVCQLDLASTFPVTPAFPAFCIVSYDEFKFHAPIVVRSWGSSNVDSDVTVTYESYEGGRLTGTFHGTLASEDVPPNPPVTVDGQFSVDVGS
jgi:hypothetical protein